MNELEQDVEPRRDSHRPRMPANPDRSTQRSSTTDRPDNEPSKATDEAEVLKRRFLFAQEKGFVFDQDQYFRRDETRSLAFSDKGGKLVTQSNDPDIAKSMVALAQAKGWTDIQVKGSNEFKREVWLEAQLRGMQVRGFRPKAVDLSRLEELRSERPGKSPDAPQHRLSRNALRSGESEYRSEPEIPLGKKQAALIETIASIMRARGDSEPAIARAVTMATERLHSDRIHVGRILEVGHARFEHDANSDPSYFVKLNTPQGVREIWGKDLERALHASGAKKGSDVVLSYEGRTSVEVTTHLRDLAGKSIGTKTIQTYRNEWRVTDLAKFRESTRTAIHGIAAKAVTVEPRLKVYDRTASPAQARPTPTLAPIKITERTRG